MLSLDLDDESIVYKNSEFFILKTVALFGIGFNVYKICYEGNKRFGTKINDPLSWFSDIEIAKNFLEKYKEKQN